MVVTILIIIASIASYLVGTAACAGAMLYDDPHPEDNDVAFAAFLGLFWPVIGTCWLLGHVGVYARNKMIAHKERKQLPEARVIK